MDLLLWFSTSFSRFFISLKNKSRFFRSCVVDSFALWISRVDSRRFSIPLFTLSPRSL